MTTNDIDAIRNLADAATEGPWAIESYDVAYVEGYRVVDARVDYVAGNFDNEAGGVLRGEDAEFIAAARTLVPALCEEIAQLRAERDDLRAITEAAVHYVNCPDDVAATGEPWDALVHAVRAAERARTQETHQ